MFYQTAILTSIVKKAETKIYRSVDTDEEREYATSVLATGNRYVTIPTDLRAIRYVQLADNSTSPAKQVYLEKDTSFMAEYYNTPSNASGFPKYYANWDEQFWVVALLQTNNMHNFSIYKTTYLYYYVRFSDY